MESLFRFVQVRPPSIKDPQEPQATVDDPNEVARALGAVIKAGTPEDEETKVQALHAATENIPDDHKLASDVPSELAHDLLTVGEAWTKKLKKLTAAKALTDVALATKQSLDKLVLDKSFLSLREETAARILAAKLQSKRNARWLQRLALLARVIAVVRVLPPNIAEGADTEELDGKIRKILSNPVRLPSNLFPIPLVRKRYVRAQLEQQLKNLQGKLNEAIAAKAKEVEQLRNAVAFRETTQRAESVREKFYQALLAGKIDEALALSEDSKAILQRLEQASPGKGSRFMARQADNAYRELIAAAKHNLRRDGAEATDMSGSVGRSYFRSAQRRVIRMQQASTTRLQNAQLSAQTVQMIRAAGLDLERDSFPVVMEAMRSIMRQNVVMVGPEIAPSIHGGGNRLKPDPLFPGDIADPVEPEGLPGVPTTVGSVMPSGIGDLLVVRQHIKRYDAGEIAHIENVVPGETRERVHELTIDSTTTLVTEAQVEKTEERDLSTTDRFEMSRETSKTVNTDIAMHVGVAASYKYGPTASVNVDATADVNRTTEKSEKEAKTYASDVTARTASRVTERVLTRREETLRRIVYERNLHKMSGVGFQKPGVYRYQWQNKVYQAQIYNYGKRLLFDIVVPEPAALYIRAARGAVNEVTLHEPAPLTESVADINEENYTGIAARYGSAIPEAPPEPEQTVPWAATIADASDPRNVNGTNELPLPDGYQLRYIEINLTELVSSRSSASLDVTVGAYLRTFDMTPNTPWQYGITASGETGTVTASYAGYRLNSGGFNIQLVCVVTDHAREQWRNKAYATIRDSYQAALDQYNNALAERAASAVPEVMGRNPDANRVTERIELRRLCIETITAQHFTHFAAVVERGNPPLPEIDFAEAQAEGSYIRFIEEAFEWESISYQFYPYFWSRRSTWIDRVLFSDKDPLFNEFLRAGAARVTVPVRPGYEELVAEFLETGIPWGTAGLPVTASGEYQSVADLIREVTDAHGKGDVAYGTPWDITIPTDLVAIREEDGSPEWEFKNNDWDLVKGQAAAWPAVAADPAAPALGGGAAPAAVLAAPRAKKALKAPAKTADPTS